MERPRRPRVEAIVLYHASVARLKKIQGMFGIIRHNSGPGGICKLIFAVLESQNTVFFTPYHWFSPILSSQNHHTTPYLPTQRTPSPQPRAPLVGVGTHAAPLPCCRALHDPLRRPAPLFVVPCLCAAGISLPQCGVCPASSVGSGTVGLFIINYYCQKILYSPLITRSDTRCRPHPPPPRF